MPDKNPNIPVPSKLGNAAAPVPSKGLPEYSQFDTKPFDKYVDFKTKSPLYHDVNDIRAFNQGNLEKIKNGLLKAGYTGLTSALDPFVALTYGVGESIIKGLDGEKGFEFADIFNNTISQNIDKGSRALADEYLPNFYTKKEQENNLLQELGTTNFWADKFANGAGYALGAFMSGYTAQGLGSAKAATKLANFFTKDAKVLKMSQTAKALGDIGNKAQNLSKAFDFASKSTIAAWGEASAEARGVINSVKDQLVAKEMQSKGYENIDQIDARTLSDIQSKANSAGNVAFALNLPLVAGTNAITFRKLLRGYETSSVATSKATDRLNRIILGEEGASVKKLNSFQKGLKMAETPFGEMTQEQLQYAIETGTESYATKKSKDGKEIVDSIQEATLEGLKNAYGTKEGWESGLLGALLGVTGVGFAGGIREEIQQNKQQETELQSLADHINSTNYKTIHSNAIKQYQLAKVQEDSLRSGNKRTFIDSQEESFNNYLLSRMKVGAYDTVIEDLKEVQHLSNDDYRTLFEIPEEVSDADIDRLKSTKTAEYQQKAQKYKDQYNTIQTSFANRSQEERDDLFLLTTTALSNQDRIEKLQREFQEKTGLDYNSFRESINDTVQNKGITFRITDLKKSIDKQLNEKGDVEDQLNNEYIRLLKERKETEKLNRKILNGQLDNEYKAIFQDKVIDRLNNAKTLNNTQIDNILDIYNDLGELVHQKDQAIEKYNLLSNEKYAKRENIKMQLNKINEIQDNNNKLVQLNQLQEQAANIQNSDLQNTIQEERGVVDATIAREQAESKALEVQAINNPFVEEDIFGVVHTPTENDLKLVTNKETTKIVSGDNNNEEIPTLGTVNSPLNERTSAKKQSISATAGNQSIEFGKRDDNGKIIKNPKQKDYFDFITTPSSWNIENLQNKEYFFKIEEETNPDVYDLTKSKIIREAEFERLVPIISDRLKISKQVILELGKKDYKAILYKNGKSTKLETSLHLTDYVHEDTMGLESMVNEKEGITLDTIKLHFMIESISTRLKIDENIKKGLDAFVQIKDLSEGHFNTIEINEKPVNYNLVTQLNKKETDDIILGISKSPDGTIEFLDKRNKIVMSGAVQGQVYTIINAPLDRKALLPIKTRKPNEQEIDTVWESLKRLTQKNSNSIRINGKSLPTIIRDIVYIDNVLGEPTDKTDKSIYVKNGVIYFGDTSSDLYSIEDEKLKDIFSKFIKDNYYTQVNINALSKNKSYTRTVFNGEDFIDQNFPSYKEYLINTDKFIDGTESILSTSITDEDNKFLQPNVYFDNNVVSEIPNFKVSDKEIVEIVSKKNKPVVNNEELIKVYGRDVIENSPLKIISTLDDYNDNFGRVINKDYEEFDIPERAFDEQEDYDKYLKDFSIRKEKYNKNNPKVIKEIKKTKKNDIEKRRKEELKANIDKLPPLDITTLEGKGKNEDSNKTNEALIEFKRKNNEINAKYDAELATLEKNEINPEKELKAKKVSSLKDKLPDSDEGIAFRKAFTFDPYKVIDIQKEYDWFKSNISDLIDFKTFEGLIHAGESNVHGYFQKALIAISNEAEEGTTYHEAFHAIFRSFLTENEINSIYKEAKTKFGDKSNLEIEELLAEQFREYILSNGTNKFEGETKNFFQRIWELIKNLIFNSISVNSLFNRINTGYYKYEVPIERKIDKFQDTAYRLKPDELTETQTNDALNSLDLYMREYMLDNGITLFQMIKNGNVILNEVYKRFYNDLASKAKEMESEGLDDTEQYKLYSAFDNFSVRNSIERMHLNHLKKFNIEASFNEELENEDTIGEEITENDYFNFKDSVEISTKDNTQANIKFFLSTIPSFNKNLNSFGLNEPSDWNTIYSFLQKRLAGISSYDEMLHRLEILRNRKPEIDYIVNKLQKSPEGFCSQFYQTFNQNKNIFYITLVNEDGEIYETQANRSTITENIIDEWKSNFKTKKFVTEDGEGNYIIEKPILKDSIKSGLEIISKYTKSKTKNKEFPINELISELDKLGITFTKDFKDNIQKIENNVQRDRERAEIYNKIVFVYKLLNSQIEENLPIEEFDNKLSSDLRVLADYESEYRDDLEEDVHLNAEGKPQYGYSLQNKLSDIVNKAKNGDLTFFKALQQKSYSKDSKWIKQILEGVKPDLIINEGIRENEVGAEGVTFKELSFADLLSAKFNPILKGVKGNRIDKNFKTQIGIQQAADKGTNYSIYGFESLLSAKEAIVQFNNNRFELLDKEAEREVINTFYKYFETELFRILKTKIEIGSINTSSPFYEYIKDEYGRIFDENLDSQRLNKDQWIIPYHSLDGDTPNGLGLKWTIFDSILSKEVKDYFESVGVQGNILINEEIQSKIEQDILNYISSKVDETRLQFIENKVLIKKPNGDIENNGIDKNILEKYENNPINSSIYHAIINDLQGKIEVTKLFLGDLAFYKDVIKRVPSLQATGHTARSDKKMNEYIQSAVNTTSKTKDNIVDGKMNIIIVKDYIVSSTNSEDMNSFMVTARDIFKKNKFTDEEINDILNKYNSTNRTDAQFWSNIETFKEAMLRIGQWSKERDIIYNKIINNNAITKQDYKNLLMLKPEKSVIVGKWETNNSLDPAVYLKNSIAPPLIPQFVKGTELENLSNLMYKNKIHYLGVVSGSKASTIGLTNIFDNNGAINPDKDLKDNINKIDWSSYKQQLEIPDKEQEKILQPTQARKLLFSNLFLNGKSLSNNKIIDFFGSKITVLDAWNIFNSAHNQITIIERDKIIEELGVEIVDNKYRILNPTKIIDKLKDTLDDLPDNIVDLIQVVKDENGKDKLLIPLDSTPLRQKIENKLNNLITSSIVKQKLSGSMNALMSDAGFYSIDKNTLQRSNELKAHLSEDGGLILEIKLPHHFKEFYGRDLSIDEIDPKLLNMIGIRIPTQGLNSIQRLKVVGFTPKEVGDIIILPSIITTISGADFDIDKLNILKYNYKLTEDENSPYLVEYIKPSNENQGKAELENIILEIYHGILNSSQNLAQQITPNSSDLLLDIRNKISKNIMTEDEWNSKFQESNGKIKAKQVSYTKYVEFIENLKAQIIFLSGKAGVGQTAVHNSSHPLFQIAGVYLSKEETEKLNFKYNSNKELASFSGINSVDDKVISETLSQLLTAFVDLAKDPFIYDLNANTFTNNTILMMVRLGVSPDWLFRFITQPSIMEYTKETFNNEGVIVEKNDTIYKQKDQLLNDILDSYYKTMNQNSKKLVDENNQQKIYSIEDLNEFQRIGRTIKSSKDVEIVYQPESYLIAQYSLLKDFVNYQELSKSFQKVVRAISSDTKGAYKELYLAQQHMDNIQDVLSSNKFIGIDRLFENNGVSTFIAGYTNNGTQLALDLYNNDIFYSQHPVFKEVLDEILTTKYLDNVDAINPRITKDKVVRKVTNQLMFNLLITGIGKYNPELVKNIFTSTYDKNVIKQPSLARILLAIKQDKENPLNENLLIKSLSIQLARNRKSVDTISFTNKPSDKEVRNLITSAWQNVVNNTNKISIKGVEKNMTVSELGKKLVLYSLYQSGMSNSGISFFSSIPSDIYLKIVQNNLNFDLFNLSVKQIDQIKSDIVANNINDNQLIPVVNKRNGVLANKEIQLNGGVLIANNSKLFNNKYIKQIAKSITGKKIGYRLYERLGVNKDRNAIFGRIDIKGEGYKFTELGLQEKSILDKNNFQKSNEYKDKLLSLLNLNDTLIGDEVDEFNSNEDEPPSVNENELDCYK